MFKQISTSTPPSTSPELEEALTAVELRLSALGAALQAQDAAAIDLQATELQRALARAIEHFMRAANTGGVPAALRTRLAHAGGQVAAQRESLARATAALDRAIDVLLPRESAPVYSNYGAADRGSRGAIQA